MLNAKTVAELDSAGIIPRELKATWEARKGSTVRGSAEQLHYGREKRDRIRRIAWWTARAATLIAAGIVLYSHGVRLAAPLQGADLFLMPSLLLSFAVTVVATIVALKHLGLGDGDKFYQKVLDDFCVDLFALSSVLKSRYWNLNLLSPLELRSRADEYLTVLARQILHEQPDGYTTDRSEPLMNRFKEVFDLLKRFGLAADDYGPYFRAVKAPTEPASEAPVA